MNNNKTLHRIGLFLVFIAASAPSVGAMPEADSEKAWGTWERTYGESLAGRDIVHLGKNTSVMLLACGSGSQSSIQLAKLDSSGDIVWRQTPEAALGNPCILRKGENFLLAGDNAEQT